jgi:hypothetical protein
MSMKDKLYDKYLPILKNIYIYFFLFKIYSSLLHFWAKLLQYIHIKTRSYSKFNETTT